MLFGIDSQEFLVIVIVGLILIGPVRAARALLTLKGLIGNIRGYSAKLREQNPNLGWLAALNTQAQEAISTIGQEADMPNLSLRELDPRHAIKEAVREEMAAWIAQTNQAKQAVSPKPLQDTLVQALTDPPSKPSKTVVRPPAPTESARETLAKMQAAADTPDAPDSSANSHTASPRDDGAGMNTPDAPDSTKASPQVSQDG